MIWSTDRMGGGGGDWRNWWKTASSMDAWAQFGQQQRDILSTLARSGIMNSGFANSMMNPAYENLYKNFAQSSAQIGDAMRQDELERYRIQMEMKMHENKPDWLGFFGNVLGLGLSGLMGNPGFLGLFAKKGP